MSKKLFVGNLSFQTTESDITTAFESFGSVESVSIITDRDTGRSKGFGFVTMEEAEGADKAIAALNGSQLDGRALTVNEAKPMVKRAGGGGGGGFRGGRSGGGGGGRNRY
jgi:cold-inducible RNA-binding protein